MIKERTATVFVVHCDEVGVWRMAFVLHPRFNGLLPAGGHVENDENGAEAALREVWEETGLRARLRPGPSLPLPDGFPHAGVVGPWWLVEMPACADRHTGEPHMHVDEVYVADVDSRTPQVEPGHPVRWFTAVELAEAPNVSEDSRLQAKAVFAMLE